MLRVITKTAWVGAGRFKAKHDSVARCTPGGARASKNVILNCIVDVGKWYPFILNNSSGLFGEIGNMLTSVMKLYE